MFDGKRRRRLGRVTRAFSFWFHTAFAGDGLSLGKHELDKAHKDSKHRKFPADFRVELSFVPHEALR